MWNPKPVSEWWVDQLPQGLQGPGLFSWSHELHSASQRNKHRLGAWEGFLGQSGSAPWHTATPCCLGGWYGVSHVPGERANRYVDRSPHPATGCAPLRAPLRFRGPRQTPARAPRRPAALTSTDWMRWAGRSPSGVCAYVTFSPLDFEFPKSWHESHSSLAPAPILYRPEELRPWKTIQKIEMNNWMLVRIIPTWHAWHDFRLSGECMTRDRTKTAYTWIWNSFVGCGWDEGIRVLATDLLC